MTRMLDQILNARYDREKEQWNCPACKSKLATVGTTQELQTDAEGFVTGEFKTVAALCIPGDCEFSQRDNAWKKVGERPDLYGARNRKRRNTMSGITVGLAEGFRNIGRSEKAEKVEREFVEQVTSPKEFQDQKCLDSTQLPAAIVCRNERCNRRVVICAIRA